MRVEEAPLVASGPENPPRRRIVSLDEMLVDDPEVERDIVADEEFILMKRQELSEVNRMNDHVRLAVRGDGCQVKVLMATCEFVIITVARKSLQSSACPGSFKDLDITS